MGHPFYDATERDSRMRDSSRRLFDDVYSLSADRQPCIICGHPTGDCTGDSAPPEVIAGMGVTEKLKEEQTFYLEEDIFVEKQITPFTKAKVLLHKKGSQIPLLEAERLGLWSPPQS
jgi:hypothetical protein